MRQLGYQPINECIIDKDPLGISYQTNLNLIELQAELNTSSISPPFFSNALNTSTFPRQQQQPLVKISDKKVHNHEEGLLVEMRINCNAIISQDPGLFVCNYTYCCSLAESIAINSSSSINNKRSGVVVDDLQDVNPDQQPRRKDDDSEVYVLFVHVPSFEIIPENDQVSFLLKLMNCIEKQITERQKSCHHYRVQTL